MSPGTKVVYVGGTPCSFCRAVMEAFPDKWRPSNLTQGRAYTVETTWRAFFPLDLKLSTLALTLVEIHLEGTWSHCSCEFREIEGDPEAWALIRRSARGDKIVELEPA